VGFVVVLVMMLVKLYAANAGGAVGIMFYCCMIVVIVTILCLLPLAFPTYPPPMSKSLVPTHLPAMPLLRIVNRN
jgi:hypothetical protein